MAEQPFVQHPEDSLSAIAVTHIRTCYHTDINRVRLCATGPQWSLVWALRSHSDYDTIAGQTPLHLNRRQNDNRSVNCSEEHSATELQRDCQPDGYRHGHLRNSLIQTLICQGCFAPYTFACRIETKHWDPIEKADTRAGQNPRTA